MQKPARIPERWRILAGIAAVVLVAYLVLVHWWFAAPMLAMGDEITDLREQEASLRNEAAQRPQIEQRMAQVRQFEASNPGFLPEGNRELASAGLVQRLEQVVGRASANPAACQITARTPSESAAKEAFPRVVVQVRLRCGMSELTAVMHELESGSPQLFIDNMELLSRRSYLSAGAAPDGALDVAFDLYGYLKVATPVAGVPRA
ncbi:MAG TPA: type II secretion system protein GspM [Arenimonas sp.]|uniref:type II secretion system protein GspM n=1 Tax=Arenimonas sp. TaxID=1872635 RepID=UPI002C5760DC|nr:type II secretion system protein GspM [Arenimonas sp.]HMB57852.1 type II secretion system protein GspM [Arenimonas sp.]